MDRRPQNRTDPFGGRSAGASVVDVPVAPIDVDPDVYASSGGLFLQVNDTVCDLVAAAAAAAGAGGAMAGTDSGGAQWAAGYDAAARTALQTGATLVDGLGRLGELLARSGANHAGADASSIPGGPPSYPGGQGAGPRAVSVIPAMPPSANGTGDDPPTGWFLVAHLVEYAWPNGHQDRLRAVAAGWTDAAAGLAAAADRLTGAVADVSALQSPEVGAAVATCTRVQNGTRALSDAYAALGRSCSDYAGYLDDAHSQVVQELVEFAAESAAIQLLGALAAVPTAGGSEVAGQTAQVARTALAAARIARFLADLLELVRAATGTLETVLAHVRQLDTQLQAVLAQGATDAVARAADTAGPAGPVQPYDLQADEGPDRGHTIDRHVGKSDAYLTGRTNKSTYASTFPDLPTADLATAQNLAAHRSEIDDWIASGAKDDLRFQLAVPGLTGRIWSKKTKNFVPPASVITVLRWSPSGYFVLSSFPGR